MRNILVILVSILISASSASGQLASYEILNMDLSARTSAMGGAITAISGDAYSLFYNPAGLSQIETRNAGITFLDYILDINAGSVVYNIPKEDYVLSVGAHFINYGDFAGYDNLGVSTGSFTPSDIVVSAGAAKQISEKLSAGVSVNGLYSSIRDYSSSALTSSAGIQYILPGMDLTVAASLSNIGFVISAYDEVKDKLPMRFDIGISKQLAHLPLLWSAEYRRLFDGGNMIVGGGEFSFSEAFKLRLGYNSYASDQKIGSEGGTLAGVSFGFGLKWRRYLIDYSFNSMGVIGSANRLSLNYYF